MIDLTVFVDKIDTAVLAPSVGLSSHNQISLTCVDHSGSVFKNQGMKTFSKYSPPLIAVFCKGLVELVKGRHDLASLSIILPALSGVCSLDGRLNSEQVFLRMACFPSIRTKRGRHLRNRTSLGRG